MVLNRVNLRKVATLGKFMVLNQMQSHGAKPREFNKGCNLRQIHGAKPMQNHGAKPRKFKKGCNLMQIHEPKPTNCTC